MIPSVALCAASVLLFSSCTLAFPPLLGRATQVVSPDGTCGASHGYTCQGSKYGNSCSKNNQCGSDISYSKLSNGCQPAYGFCYAQGSVSPDGSCGGSDMFICIGSNYGNSCGPYNLCGRDAGYSGTGCQPQYGYCQQCTMTVKPSTTTTTKSTTTTQPVTVSASTTVTVLSGISSTTVTTTTTSVATSVSTILTTSTVTPTPATTTTTTSVVSTVSSGVTTVTVTQASFQKRAKLSPATDLPSLPIKIAASVSPSSSGTVTDALRLLLARATATGAGLSCGTVISTGFTTTTVSTTMTLTAFSTTTTVSSSFTTAPSSTTTLTSTSTSVTTTVSLSTSTTVTTAPTATITATATSVSTTVIPTSTATVVVASPIYSKAYERTDSNSCFYSGSYYQQVSAPDDSSNNYANGKTGCAAACTNQGASCQAFYYSDSTGPSGARAAYCLLIAHSSGSSDVSCNYQTTTLYLVIYNKVSG